MAGPTAKGYAVSDIHQGPGDLWIIGTPPTDTTQRLTLDAATGTPDIVAHPNSICLGPTEGGITTALKLKITDIAVDQFEAPVDSFLEAIEASIDAEVAQQTVSLLQQSLSTGVYSTVTSPGYNQVTFGGINAVPTVCIAAISPKRTGSNLWCVSLLYRCASKGGITIMQDRKKKSTHKVNFTGQSDITRTAGRQIGVYYETT